MNNTSPHDAQSLKSKGGIARIINATRYSWQGFRAAFLHEAAFRQELILALVMIPIALFLPVSFIEKLFLILTVLNVLLVEILNSAIEAVVDRFGTELHELSGRAKDLGSAAVFIALMMSGITWLFIIGHWLLTQTL